MKGSIIQKPDVEFCVVSSRNDTQWRVRTIDHETDGGMNRYKKDIRMDTGKVRTQTVRTLIEKTHCTP